MDDYYLMFASGAVTVWALARVLALVADPEPGRRPPLVPVPAMVIDQALEEIGGRS